MAKRNYQLAWSTEYKDGHMNVLKESYGTLESAIDVMNNMYWNSEEHISRTAKIIYKPTGEVLKNRVW